LKEREVFFAQDQPAFQVKYDDFLSYSFGGQLAGYYVAPAAAGLATFVGALWVARKLTSAFLANGTLVGAAAVVLTGGPILVAKPEDRFMYGVSFGPQNPGRIDRRRGSATIVQPTDGVLIHFGRGWFLAPAIRALAAAFEPALELADTDRVLGLGLPDADGQASCRPERCVRESPSAELGEC
jgi:hypothetical protein